MTVKLMTQLSLTVLLSLSAITNINAAKISTWDYTPTIEDEATSYAINNMLSVFYHELGHGLIDQLNIPRLGNEEDAADTLSVVMINRYFDTDDATTMILDVADHFQREYKATKAADEKPAFWDVHSTDAQRYATQACLIYGANTEARDKVREKINIPFSRAISCEEEYEKVEKSWAQVIGKHLLPSDPKVHWMSMGKMIENPSSSQLSFQAVIYSEVAAFQEWDFAEDVRISVNIDSCDEPNAYYDPDTASITLCTELLDVFYTNYLAVHKEEAKSE